MNVALEQLLITMATMDCHCKELDLNTKLTMHMNETQAAGAIKEAKVSHAAEVKEAEVHHTTAIKDAEMHHTTAIKEVKLHHTTQIKEAEVHCTTNSCVLQQPTGKVCWC